MSSEEMARLRRYAGYCGPKAYSKITGVSSIDAAVDLTLATLLIGEDAPVDGTYNAAMARALKEAGVKIVATMYPSRPAEEWIEMGRPVNWGDGWGDWKEDAYIEARYTLAQWLRLPESQNGLYLLIIGGQGNAHYVVVEDGKVTEGQLNYGNILRRRVGTAHLLERSTS